MLGKSPLATPVQLKSFVGGRAVVVVGGGGVGRMVVGSEVHPALSGMSQICKIVMNSEMCSIIFLIFAQFLYFSREPDI